MGCRGFPNDCPAGTGMEKGDGPYDQPKVGNLYKVCLLPRECGAKRRREKFFEVSFPKGTVL